MPNTELFKKIRRIQFLSTKLATDILAGAYRSAFKGKGMEFEDVREYVPGDDVRSIDWNVTARMDHPYIKNYREERDLTVHLMVDISASTRFGGMHGLKSTLIAELAAVLAFSAIKNNDRIGLILFTDQIEKYIPPGKGARHVLRMIRDILYFQPKHKNSSIQQALSFLGKVQRRSGICFLISDFLERDYAHDAALIASSQDLIAIQVRDENEEKFPSLGLVNVQDLESGQEALIDTKGHEFTEKSQEFFAVQNAYTKKLMKRIGAGFIDIRSNQPFIVSLQKFFKMRARKRQ